jgi:NAD-dependent SIR2 family protein deacetylase
VNRLSRREKLAEYNTIDDAANLIRKSKRIVILTGAGISESEHTYIHADAHHDGSGVSCGIPDFRSRDGLYAQLKQRGDYDLDDPQQMSVHTLIPDLSR